MDHGNQIERRVREDLMRLAKDLQLPLLATNDLHYVKQEDAIAQDALLCINSGSKLHDPDRFKFDGEGYYLKTAEEMRLALGGGIRQFNVESEPELHALSEVASRVGKTARIALRVNPDVDAQTHAHITTGLKSSKFGVPLDRASLAKFYPLADEDRVLTFEDLTLNEDTYEVSRALEACEGALAVAVVKATTVIVETPKG